jgi:hypothetical protein
VKKSPKCSQAHFCQKNTYSTYTLEKVAPKMWATYIIFQKLPKVRKFAQPGHLVWKQKAFFFISKNPFFAALPNLAIVSKYLLSNKSHYFAKGALFCPPFPTF